MKICAADDVLFWNLTPRQEMHYRARLVQMHARTARRFADQASMHARRGLIASRISIGLAVVAVLLALAGVVF